MSTSSLQSPADTLRTREAILERAAVDLTARTVRATLSTEAPITRYGSVEVLRHSPETVDLARADGGLPLLWSHDRTIPIGVCEGVRLDGSKLVCTLRFGSTEKADEVLQLISEGVLRHVSIGYSIDAWENSSDGAVVATRWTLYEASVVSIPADTAARIGRQAGLLHSNRTMNTDTTNQESRREIDALVRRHGLDESYARILNACGATPELARSMVLEELARRDEQAGGHLNVLPSHAGNTRADASHVVDSMAEVLASRCGGPDASRDNPYRGLRVVDMVRELLERSGVRTGSLTAAELLKRFAAHTSGDFPNLLQATGNRVLRQAYGSYGGGVRNAFRRSTSPDFRAKAMLMLGEAPELLKVNEHGEFKYGSIAEAAESYRLTTFGRIFAITRQAMINDDLNAFGDMAVRLGRAAAEFESKFLVSLLTSNPVMADAQQVFHSSRGNLATGAGSALSVTSLWTARTAMRLQKGLDGVTPIDAAPRYLIVPAALEQAAYQYTSTNYTPAKQSDVNPLAGQLEVLVDPRLDAVSSTAWYLAADPAVIDTIEYSYLEGEEGPQVLLQEGFDIDGTAFKVRLDFGAGVLDFRGLYRAAGA